MAIQLKPLDQQVIVITGASSGIGLATAQTAAKRGATVVLASRSEETLDHVVRDIKAAGGDASWFPCDVSNQDDIDRVARDTIATYGRFDTWVNNAGLSVYGKLDEVPIADMRRLFDINFWGVVYGSRAALRHLRSHGGAIINVGSEVSEAVVPLQGIYSASKHAVKGFNDALRVEVEEVDKLPVSITLIQPTATDTNFPQNARNYMDKEPKLPDPLDDPQDVADPSSTRPSIRRGRRRWVRRRRSTRSSRSSRRASPTRCPRSRQRTSSTTSAPATPTARSTAPARRADACTGRVE